MTTEQRQPDRLCAHCGDDIAHKRPQATFCNDRCRDRARRIRNRDVDRAHAQRRYRERRTALGHEPRSVGRVVDADVDWQFGPEVYDEACRAAAYVAKRWRRVVPVEDLRQEAFIWAATHPATIAAHRADPNRGLGFTGWAMRSALVKVSQREYAVRQREVLCTPAALERRAAETDEVMFALVLAHNFVDDPGPRGDAAREYLAGRRQEGPQPPAE